MVGACSGFRKTSVRAWWFHLASSLVEIRKSPNVMRCYAITIRKGCREIMKMPKLPRTASSSQFTSGIFAIYTESACLCRVAGKIPPYLSQSHFFRIQLSVNHMIGTDPPPRNDLALPIWASLVIAFSFGTLGMLTLGGAILFIASISSATGAPQEAAAGAIFSALFIAGYIITRSIEKVVRSIARR
jgi:hypothetical protein